MKDEYTKKKLFSTLKTLIIFNLFCSIIIGSTLISTYDYVDTEATVVNIASHTTRKSSKTHTTYILTYEYTYNNKEYVSELKYPEAQYDDRDVGFTETIKIDPNNPESIRNTPKIIQYKYFSKAGSFFILFFSIIQLIKHKSLKQKNQI